jgi:lysozyme
MGPDPKFIKQVGMEEERAEKGKRGRRTLTAAVAAVLLLISTAAVLGYLYYTGYLWFNEPSREEYPVRGVDVSEHQGTIDWRGVRQAGYDFAFIKATEGLDHVDSTFRDNWAAAGEAGLTRGAYHFFTFRRTGAEQAANFIANVPAEEGGLPPAVDIELGGNSAEVPDRETFRRELDVFLLQLEKHYGRKPILYVNDESYQRFIKGAYEEYPIWNADVFRSPGLAGGRSWLFWQYNPRGHVNGINGYVDLDVFNGTPEEFRAFVEGG